MASFKDMNLNIKNSIKEIEIGGQKVMVKQYLPAEDKNSILENAMQQADQGTILNTFSLEVIFNVYLVIKYTDIDFTTEEKTDLFKLYDILESNNIINLVISAIPEEEYQTLRDNLLEMVNKYNEYRNSARALFEQFTLFAPQAAEQLKEVTNNFDEEKIQKIINLADKTGINNRIGQ